jgi:transcriptional regulator with XRE-family HTH domain
MDYPELASYLRSHRRKSGLSQKELGVLLGYPDKGQVSRHERLTTMPSLLTALTYQAIFCVPISELFPGVYEAVKQSVEERLENLKEKWHGSEATGPNAELVARKLEWSWERNNLDQSDFLNVS